MTWQQLLAANKVQPHITSLRELTDLRALVARDLNDAALPGLSDDRRFATAYNAILQLGKMVIACSGYRVTGVGHHQTTIAALALAMGSGVSTLVAYFDTCRRKRNILDYDMAQVISSTEAAEILKKANQFQQIVESWIAQHYPACKKP